MADPAVIAAGAALGGVAVTALANAMTEWRRARRELATRWDKELAGASGEYLATARRLLHTARRVDRYADRDAAVDRLDERHEELRALAPRVALLGSFDVQYATRHIIRAAYAVRLMGEGLPDPRPDDPNGDPVARLEYWLQKFEVAVRHDLKVKDPSAVVDESTFS